MDKSLLHAKAITLYLLLFTVRHVLCDCSGFSGIGHTYPVGDIFIEYNTSIPLEITCVVTNEAIISNTPNISSQLYFEIDYVSVPSEKIIRLNETSIKLVEENPEKKNVFYNCMFNKSAICMNNVVVGLKPQNVTDFKCIGYNYDNLTCAWTPPYNYIKTNYSLSYIFPGRAGLRPTDCNVTDDKKTGKKKCFWGPATRPHYRQVQPLYKFTLKSENRFGTLEQAFTFDHLKNILASPPENLACINKTTSSLLLHWKVPTALVPFGQGIEHRVMYQCSLGENKKIWQFGGRIETKNQEDVTYNLTGLQYAHDYCVVRVAIRVMEAISEEMWSANASKIFQTSSTIPGMPPRVNKGGFQANIDPVAKNVREIYVYWQQLAVEMKNAESCEYVITVNDSSGISNKIPKMSNTYAIFSNMSVNSPLQFTIRSKNANGHSKDSSVIVVPGNDKMIGEPIAFSKVAFDNGLYKLSWEKPKRGGEYVETYTLFWCSNAKDRPFECEGYLNWTEVPANITEYNITVTEDQTTQFAISANNATSSSGMVWATCTVRHDTKMTKIKEVWITKVDSTFIELGWKLHCDDRRDNVAGYVINYCPRFKDSGCKEQKKLIINSPSATMGRVTGLTPYTTYILTVSMINKQNSESLESDPLYNTTYEDVSSEPYDVNVVDVTNSSISVEWKSPKYENGYIRNYALYLNNTKLEAQNKTYFTFRNLPSDTMFNITVEACTQKCSNRSEPVLVATNVGRPGPIPDTWAGHPNNTLTLYWQRTEERRRHNLYEVAIKYKAGAENVSVPIFNTTETYYRFPHCGEDGKYSGFYFTVRAVNFGNETLYPGPWAEEKEHFCEQGQESSLIWIVIAVGCLAFVCVLFFSGKRLYVYLDEMKNIVVKMPEGLDPQIDSNWIQPKQPPSANDEERLLHKTFVPRSGDSSGCSSGQESVSSDSGSSITSTSDSGTEQPRLPAEEDPEPEPEPPEVSPTCLQFETLKPTAESQPYVQMPDRMMPWNMTVNTNGYSMYGVPDVSNSGNSGHSDGSDIELMGVPLSIQLPKTEITESSPYMTCDEILKPRSMGNSAYVQLNNTQEKNPPYVMAADKNAIMSNLFYPNRQMECQKF